ncbi:hypothetical protein J2Z20_000802 [Paenibacillus sediminis]|uniref:VCBS repeat-containing protein n=1 Tax=Paenibacillus sediminis TaxID=664909 RepID=A0ABS4H082_9BACL|nr:hypothetical protein [Paenibacillus sediminis]
MLKSKWIRALLGCVILLMISGCELTMDPKSLMKTPELSVDRENIKSVITAQLPEGSTIIRPRDATNTSSIRITDLNHDGINETVVFYETPDDTVRIHGMILEKKGNTWMKQLTFDGEGIVLESFELKDVTNDGKIDIVAGYSSGDDELQKGLVVYTYNGKTLDKELELPYTKFVLDDLNGDKINDISVISLKRNEYASVTVYQYDSGFKELDKLQLDPYVNEFYNVVSGNVAKNRKGLILDTSVGTHSAYSHVIVMENQKLIDVLPQDQTFKDYQTYSGDVNGDGILELGLLETPKGWEYVSFDEIPWLFSYYQWDGESGLKFVMQQYRDLKGRFYFNFPKEWYNKVTVDPKSNKDQYLKFVIYDTGETVAEIQFFSLSQWERVKSNWEMIARDNDKVIGFRSSKELKLGTTDK